MNLEYSGEEAIPVGDAKVWAFVTDPEKVGRCLPEVIEVSVKDATHFDAVVQVAVGPVRGKFTLKVELAPDPAARRIGMKISGGGFGSAVDLTAGARYTYDKKTMSDNVPDSGGALGNNFNYEFFTNGAVKDSANWSDFTPRIALSFQLNDDVNLYATASRGYKSGGFATFGFDLHGQLARGDEDDRLGCSASLRALKDRNGKGGGFSGAGLCNAHDVFPLDGNGDGLRLNGCRCRQLHATNHLKKRWRNAESVKSDRWRCLLMHTSVG